jgi:hypothetical protein
MEKISDFFSELKERLNNPLILSYLIAWCIWNYKIVIGLVFYKTKELKGDGYDSYLNLIRCEGNLRHFLIFPLLSAVIYVLIYPIIKNLILALGVWADTWGSNWNIKIGKTLNVPVETHLLIEERYKKSLERVVEYSKNETDYINQIAELNTSLNQKNSVVELLKFENSKVVEKMTNDLTREKTKYQNFEDVNSLDHYQGAWLIKKMQMVHESNGNTIVTPINYEADLKGNILTMLDTNQNKIQLAVINVTCNFQNLFFDFSNNPSVITIVDTWKFKIKERNFSYLKGFDKNGKNVEFIRKMNIVISDTNALITG